MSLFSLTNGNKCPKTKTPGMSSQGYIGILGELDGFPRTVAEIALAADPQAALNNGDTKRLGEAFAYLTGGYHREITLLVDSADAANNSVGEVGSLMNEGIFRGFIEGDDDEVREYLDCLRRYSGCMQIIAQAKSDIYVSIGTPAYPVYLRSYSGGTGGGSGDARIGYNLEFFCGDPDTYRSIDLSLFPLGLTPAT